MNRWGREGRDDYLMVDVDDNGCGWVMALLQIGVDGKKFLMYGEVSKITCWGPHYKNYEDDVTVKWDQKS